MMIDIQFYWGDKYPDRVGEPCIDSFEQPQPSVSLPEQQQAAITGDIPAGKLGLDPAAFYRWKVEADLGTSCHGQSPV